MSERNTRIIKLVQRVCVQFHRDRKELLALLFVRDEEPEKCDSDYISDLVQVVTDTVLRLQTGPFSDGIRSLKALLLGLDGDAAAELNKVANRLLSIHLEMAERVQDAVLLKDREIAEAACLLSDEAGEVLSTLLLFGGPLEPTDDTAGDEWSEARSPSEWCKTLGLTRNTVKKYEEQGEIRIKKITSKQWQIHKDDVEKFSGK